jgi:hypothetical protein
MRRNGSTIEFVVDDDYGIAPDAALTGEPYTNVPPCMPGGFTAPSSDLCPTTDPWGKTIPGYASIFNSQGTMVGIVGVNRDNSSR